MISDMAMKMGKNLFKPCLSEMDKIQPEYVGGKVKVHPAVKNHNEGMRRRRLDLSPGTGRTGRAAVAAHYQLHSHVNFRCHQLLGSVYPC